MNLSDNVGVSDEPMDDDSIDDQVRELEVDLNRSYVTNMDSCSWFDKVDFVVANGPRGLIINEADVGGVQPLLKSKSRKKNVGLTFMQGLSTGNQLCMCYNICLYDSYFNSILPI